MKETDYLDENALIVKRLTDLPVFKSFEENDLKKLMNFSKVREYEPGEIIIREGDTDRCIFFILSGRVHVMKDGVQLAKLGRVGDVFGEMAVIQSRPRTASVEAVDKTLCLMVDAAYMDILEEEDKGTFMYVIFRIFSMLMAGRLTDTTEALIAARKEIEKLKEVTSSE